MTDAELSQLLCCVVKHLSCMTATSERQHPAMSTSACVNHLKPEIGITATGVFWKITPCGLLKLPTFLKDLVFSVFTM